MRMTTPASTLSGIPPYGLNLAPRDKAVYRFVPLPSVRLQEITQLQIQLTAQNFGQAVISLWDWGTQIDGRADNAAADLRNPRLTANGKIFGVSQMNDALRNQPDFSARGHCRTTWRIPTATEACRARGPWTLVQGSVN